MNHLIRIPAAFAAATLLALNAWAQQAPPLPDSAPLSRAASAPAGGPGAARPPSPGAERGPDARGPRPGDAAREQTGQAQAQASTPTRAPAPETTLTGRVARWLVNPNGDVDGLLLDDGTQVAFPPHLSARLTDAVQVKDTVEVTGRRSEGAKVVRASSIKSTRSGQSVAIASRDPQAAAPRPRPAGALTAMNASGRIETLLYTGRGDVNGALLRDGTVVRFPPHAVAQMSDTLKPGAALYARGYGTAGPQGNAFEATAIGPTAESARELFAGAGPEAARRPPAPARGERPAPPPAPAASAVPPAPRAPA